MVCFQAVLCSEMSMRFFQVSFTLARKHEFSTQLCVDMVLFNDFRNSDFDLIKSRMQLMPTYNGWQHNDYLQNVTHLQA